MVNPNKTPSFTAQERADFLRRVTGHIPNVKVDVYTGLLAEYAHNVGACTIIKGLRAVTDFEFEFQQALTNKKLNPELETMFVITVRNICTFRPAWCVRWPALAATSPISCRTAFVKTS